MPNVPGSVLVNTGQLLRQITNDTWKAARHYAVNPNPSERCVGSALHCGVLWLSLFTTAHLFTTARLSSERSCEGVVGYIRRPLSCHARSLNISARC